MNFRISKRGKKLKNLCKEIYEVYCSVQKKEELMTMHKLELKALRRMQAYTGDPCRSTIYRECLVCENK